MDLCPSEKWAWHLLFSFEDSLKYKYRIAWFPSCLSGSSKNGQYWPDPSKKAQDLTGFKQKRPASDRNQAKKAWIWPDPSKKPGSDLIQAKDLDLTGSKQNRPGSDRIQAKGLNLIGSKQKMPRSDRIQAKKASRWPDPSRKDLDLIGSKQKRLRSDRIQAEKV